MTFREALAEQRWDDHRFYHHNRINQSLHLVSALCFIAAYALLFVEPVAAVLIAWLLAMPSRQLGHFFFEPQSYDHANQVTHEYKEEVKVGYNLHRKVVLLAIWVLSPAVLLVDSSRLSLVRLARNTEQHLDRLAGGGCRRGRRSDRSSLLLARCADGPRLGDQNPHRPVP